MAKIRLYHHVERNLAANRDNPVALANIARELSRQIEDATLGQSPESELSVPNLEIDAFAQLHADKWIEGIGDHVSRYANAISAPDLSVPGALVNDGNVQKAKSFSGDVSGVIGETLFTIVVERCYGLTDERIAHLRAHKQTGFYPDFGIYFPSQLFLDELSSRAMSFESQYAFPCEVKTITTIDKGTIFERLYKAIQQTQNYWERNKRDGTSIICVALRNSLRNAYDVHLVWCQ